jgi:putative ABC transport system permease protein
VSTLGLRPTSVRAGEAIAEAVRAISARPARSVLTASGTVIGMAALVATISLTATARAQIADVFAALHVGEIGVTALTDGAGPPFEWRGLDTLRSRPDVHRAGILHGFDEAARLQVSRHAEGRWVTPYALDGDVLEVVDPTFAWGGLDRGSPGAGRTVLVARSVAEAIGVTTPSPGQTVLVNGYAFALGGVFRDVAVHNELLLGLVLSPEDAAAIGLGTADSPPTPCRSSRRQEPRDGSQPTSRTCCRRTRPTRCSSGKRPPPRDSARRSTPRSAGCSCSSRSSHWGSAGSASLRPP